jgi:hypothetical protein
MGAYKITLKLQRLDEPCVRHALTAESAALVAWELCEKHGLGMPNRSWKLNHWDSFEGRYETIPITDLMLRGMGGKYPLKVEFMHGVIDKLTELVSGRVQTAMRVRMTNMPHTIEPNDGLNRFETFRDNDNLLLVEYDPESEWSVIDELSMNLDEAICKLDDSEEFKALTSMLEEKIEAIKSKQKKRKAEKDG